MSFHQTSEIINKGLCIDTVLRTLFKDGNCHHSAQDIVPYPTMTANERECKLSPPPRAFDAYRIS